jgi:ketosteroid isomerase-like protein
VEQDSRPEQSKKPGVPDGELENDRAVEEFFNRLKQDMRRPKPGQDSVAAVLQAIQRLALEADVEQSAEETAHAGPTCQSCGSPNRQGNRFCANCGVPLPAASGEAAPQAQAAQSPGQPTVPPAGPHHYHHHYHHHYFAPGEGLPAGGGESRPPTIAAARDAGRLRAPLTGPSLSRTEAAARKLTQDWALACNTKQLNDLVELYAADALVLRPNVPLVRGTAAIREFFFALLDAGMGEVELETLRAEVLGDTAYDAGRCKSLVPVALNKRREERGKYLLLLNRAPGGDWKIVADTWSSDLNLTSETSASATPAPSSTLPKPPRKP